jgi:hypothetical protein
MRRSHRHAVRLVATWIAFAWVLSAPPSADPQAPFTEEAVARGLLFVMGPNPQVQGYVGQGSGLVDLDADGDLDVVLLGRADGQVGIFENTGGGNFSDHSETSDIPLLLQQEGISTADYDADGLLDLYITQAYNRTNLLLKNNGDFTFTDVSASSNASNGYHHSTGSSWGDYNADGWPDLYVSNYGQSNALYRNNGNGTFSNVAPGVGVDGGNALSFQSAWSDFDRDGDLDLYVTNDRAFLGWPANYFFRNDGGIFTDVSEASGTDVAIFAMGLGVGDIDDNGYPDYYVTNINSVESNGGSFPYDGVNPLLLNQGDGTFVDSTENWGTDNRITSWSAILFDWDNDSRQDIYVNNQFVPNSFFHCDTVPCTERAEELGIEAAYDPYFDVEVDPPTIASFVASAGDVDGDGDVDLLVNNLGHRAELFINHEGERSGWIRYRAVGPHPNLFAIGAGIETEAGGKTQYHEIYAGGNGYLGQNELTVHVGLGEATTVERTSVSWPGTGTSRTLTGLPVEETWTLYPPERLCDADGGGMDYDDFAAFADCCAQEFAPGCEMMDFDGDSDVYVDDMWDCSFAVPEDCNENGTEDLLEILIDLDLDLDRDYRIDCCDGPGQPKEPYPVGPTLVIDRTPGGAAVLSWAASGSDSQHLPPTSYDVFRSEVGPADGFRVIAGVGETSYTDSDPGTAYYVVSAHNDCGSSGEEPF